MAETKPFDPEERAREKQASRDQDQDEKDLASGAVTREELKRRNGAFSFPRDRVRIVEYK